MKRFLVILLVAGAVFATASPQALASLWASDWGGGLYSVNTGNAALTMVGNTGLDKLAALEFAPTGQLYGFNVGAGAGLYKIDPFTAATTLVGSFDANFEGGLAFSSSGVAYGVNKSSNASPILFSIDLNTGATTDIGQMGTDHDINGLSWRSDGMLVGIDEITQSLVTINPSTAAIANLAYLGIDCGGIGGMTTDYSTGISYFATGIALDVHGNSGTNSLYTFDLNSGAFSLVAPFSGSNDAYGISGLAGSSAIPEPGTLLLLGLGLAGGAVRRRMRRKA